MASFLTWTLPMPVVASTGDDVTLSNILNEEFGANSATYNNFWVGYQDATYLANQSFLYWDPPHAAVTKWYLNGADIGIVKNSFHQAHVSPSQLGAADLLVGNDIGPLAFITVPISFDGAQYTQYIQYSITTIPASLMSPTAGSGAPNPADIVAAAERFAAAYPGVPNTNDCHFIAQDVAASAGAVLNDDTGSIDPTQNAPGGFWRIVYRGSDPNPVSNWSSLVQPGDIVRMGFQNGGFHTTTVLNTSATANSDGTYDLTVYDNNALSTGTTIGIHTAHYDRFTIPGTITIYRLSPDHLYLIQGSDQAQTLVGNMFNDEIVGGSGNDIIVPGSGSYNVLTGGGGSDVLRLSRISATAVDTITDYDQGNSGIYSSAEGDQIDLSALLSSAYDGGNGDPVASLVRIFEDPSDSLADLQIDATATSAGWTTVAQLDGIHGGDTVNLILDSSAPLGTDVVVGSALIPLPYRLESE
jgi:hypothetical protein